MEEKCFSSTLFHFPVLQEVASWHVNRYFLGGQTLLLMPSFATSCISILFFRTRIYLRHADFADSADFLFLTESQYKTTWTTRDNFLLFIRKQIWIIRIIFFINNFNFYVWLDYSHSSYSFPLSWQKQIWIIRIISFTNIINFYSWLDYSHYSYSFPLSKLYCPQLSALSSCIL